MPFLAVPGLGSEFYFFFIGDIIYGIYVEPNICYIMVLVRYTCGRPPDQ